MRRMGGGPAQASASGSYRNLQALAASGILDGDGLEAGGPLRAVGDGRGGGFPGGMGSRGSRGSMDSLEASRKSSRFILVSNHLPIKMERSPSSGEWQFEWDEDALIAQAAEGVGDDVDVFYVGCLPSDEVSPSEQEVVALELYTSFRCCPVFLGAELRERHYKKFCKQQLWPLLHYLMALSPTSAGRFDADLWGSYVKANKAFADVVVEVVGNVKRDLVWVNDYHLLVLPSLLRKRLHRIRLGLSLHSPFPSSEVFRTFPRRDEVLRSMLNADLVGFHTFDYARHFLSCCSRMLGLEHVNSRGSIMLEYYGRSVGLKIMPTGVKPERFLSAVSWPDTAWRRGELAPALEGQTVLLGVDDLDPFKGVELKMLAFERVLDAHPEWRGRLTLVQVSHAPRAPGRDVAELLEYISGVVERFNAKHGAPSVGGGGGGGGGVRGAAAANASNSGGSDVETAAGAGGSPPHASTSAPELLPSAISSSTTSSPPPPHPPPPAYTPIIWLQRTAPLYERVALYCAADVVVVTATRDGMNLVPYEYVVCRQGAAAASAAALAAGSDPTAAAKAGAEAALAAISALPRPLSSNSQQMKQMQQQQQQGSLRRPSGPCFGSSVAPGAATSTLVVSEFVGCSPSLSGAIRVNPWSVDAVADGIYSAITLPRAEAAMRHDKHWRYVSSHTARFWAQSFAADLRRLTAGHASLRCYGLGLGLDSFRCVALTSAFRRLEPSALAAAYARAERRLLLLDYDGTLNAANSVSAAPTEATLRTLRALCADSERNAVYVVSGRARAELGAWFSTVPALGIAAEHGYYFRPAGGKAAAGTAEGGAAARPVDDGWITRGGAKGGAAAAEEASSAVATTSGGADDNSNDDAAAPTAAVANDEAMAPGWRGIVVPVLRLYTESTDGSWVEEKESAVVWHYASADPDFGSWQAKELLDHLEGVLSTEDAEATSGAGIVEVKPRGVSKGGVAERVLMDLASKGNAPGFVLCVGDDRSDEDMFVAMEGHVSFSPHVQAEVFACTVGQKPSRAPFYVNEPADVAAALELLAETAPAAPGGGGALSPRPSRGGGLAGGGGASAGAGGAALPAQAMDE